MMGARSARGAALELFLQEAALGRGRGTGQGLAVIAGGARGIAGAKPERAQGRGQKRVARKRRMPLDALDGTDPGGGAFDHGQRDGPVELDYGRRFEGQELSVKTKH